MSADLAPDAPLEQVEWRVQGKIDRGDGVQVVAYLDAPTISRLLDEWVGPDRWRDHYEPTGKPGTMWCHLSIRFNDEWVTKEDLGTASDMEADKGLVSDAFKRVAMRKWGVGRNVFDLPILRITQFRKVERQGKDPMAYLTDESHAEIARLLTSRGFTEAAERTRVNAAADAAGADRHEDLMRELDEVIVEAESAGVEFDSSAARQHARGGVAPAQRSIQVLRQRIEEKAKQDDEGSGTQAGAPAAGTEPGERDASPSPAADAGSDINGGPSEGETSPSEGSTPDPNPCKTCGPEPRAQRCPECPPADDDPAALAERARRKADGNEQREAQRQRINAAFRRLSPDRPEQYRKMWERLKGIVGGHPNEVSWAGCSVSRLKALADDAERLVGQLEPAS